MENLTVKITGGGTRKDVAKALITIARQILDTPVEELDGCEWEDCTLMTEVECENDDEVCEHGCGEPVPAGSLYCPNCGEQNY